MAEGNSAENRAPTIKLRPAWRRVIDYPLVAMMVALVALVVPLLLFGLGFGAALGMTGHADLHALPAWAKIVQGLALAAIAVMVAKLVLPRLGRFPRDDLPLRACAQDFVTGIVLAAMLMSLIVGVAATLGGYRILGWGGSGSLPFILAVAGVQAAFFEEIVARGILFRFLEEFGGSWFALAASSLLFGFAHAFNPNATLLSSIAIAVEAGILLGGAYMLTRNLWFAIGIHFGWNVTQGYIWDVPVSGMDVDGLVRAQATGDPLVSGGAFGLEASLVAMVLATAMGISLVWLAARRGHIVRPIWRRGRDRRPLDGSAHSVPVPRPRQLR